MEIKNNIKKDIRVFGDSNSVNEVDNEENITKENIVEIKII